MFRSLIAAAIITACSSAVWAESKTADFGNEADVQAWTLAKGVELDKTKDHSGKEGASLKIAPGGKATWKLRDKDGTGDITLWVYDDMSKPADTKANRAGPRWGLLQADGRTLVMGVLYANYVAGDKGYNTSEVAPGDKAPLGVVQAPRLNRSEGWHKWTFSVDDKGVSITMDGKKARFDASKTKITGFTGIVLLGDKAGENAQTFWVDDVSVTLGAEAAPKVAPASAPAAAGTLPEKDPAPEKKVALVPAAQGKHPRLLFSAADVARLKKDAQDGNKVFYDALLTYLPACNPSKEPTYLTNATDAQREGLWKAPTAALHYVLTKDRKSLDKSVAFLRGFLAQEHWETGNEEDSGMGAANIMIGAALAYDWLYDDLPQDLRDAFGKKLLLQARRMYNNGHLMKSKGTHYWQGDPQNNHRWHRDAGLTLAILAVAEDPDAQWLLSKTLDELKFVADWLPDDGTSHESPTYMVFGAPQLYLAMDAADKATGSDFIGRPFFKNLPAYRLNLMAPGFKDSIYYGDSAGTGAITGFLFRSTARHKLVNEQAAVMEFMKDNPKSFLYGWFGLVWNDPTLAGGSIDKLQKATYFADLGMLTARDSWKEQGVALMFKCSPPGGAKLNEYRNANGGKYINVAHDDPDANMIEIYGKGAFIAEDDRYADPKSTAAHNTLLVNGKGQITERGGQWTQPVGKADMTKFSYVTGQKVTDELAVVEGEAGASYKDLSRFRRTAVWARGKYILIVDDIAAPNSAEITWLLQSKNVTLDDAKTGKLTVGPGACPLTVLSDVPLDAAVGKSPANHRGNALNFAQAQMKASTKHLRVAALFDPWNRYATLKVDYTPEGATLTVNLEGKADTWTFPVPKSETEASDIKASLDGGGKFSLR